MARSYGLGFACFTLLAAAASATQFRVGGRRGWSVPDANVEPYNAWAGRMRFQIGDQLLFVYPKETDSVLLVEPSAYNACNASSYVKKFEDGSTVFTFDRSGPFFFISGNEANCRTNEKLVVVVLADRTPPAVSPAPSLTPPTSAPMPSPSTSPPSAAPMPAPAATPSSPPSPTASAPAPAPTTTPSSPPSPPSSPATPGGVPQTPSASANAPGAEGVNSTTPSANDQSGAAPVVAGFVTSLGAYVGYAMLAI